MKPKLILLTLTVWMICFIFSTSQGADEFYYGGFHGGQDFGKLNELRDSLRFNIVHAFNLNQGNIYYWTDASLQVIAEQDGSVNSPTHWSRISHYTSWEAEGYPGSYYNLTYHGGSWAEGGRARYFDNLKIPPDTAGFIQTGPNYVQEQKDANGYDIQYTAIFRLKSPLYFPSAMGSGKPAKLCSLMVVGNGQLLGDTVVYGSEFNNTVGYKSYNIVYKATQNPIEFQIYWYGNRQLYIDYVKVRDQNGYDLIDDPNHTAANNIKTYVNQSWVTDTLASGDTVIHRWYMRDEPPSIDCYEPYRYIDSLLRNTTPYIPGCQFYADFGDTLRGVHDYLLRSEPVEYMIDPYPFRATDTPSNYQTHMDLLIHELNQSKLIAESRNKDFWVAIQGHLIGREKTISCPCDDDDLEYVYDGLTYCYWYRDPTPNEMRFQTFLALCHGADAVMIYHIPYFRAYILNTKWCSDSTWYLETGLYDDIGDTVTQKWEEIKNFTGPRVEKLGSIIKDITWQGACFGDSVGDFNLRNGPHSYIDSIVGIRHPDSTYVQVGFFTKSDSMFFMLVNRRTLPSENDTFEVYFNFSDGPYVVNDMYNPILPDGKICGLNRYKIFLQPGEGRLFKLDKFRPYCVYCVPRGFDPICYPPVNTYATIQSAIDAVPVWEYTTVLVDTGTYYENIDFKGKHITVAGRFHLSPDHQEFVDKTIIDGSYPVDTTKASVVRFVSGENSNAILKGFTIRNGKGTVTHTEEDLIARWGGGIECYNSSPTIINNVIISNNALPGSGGGIYSNSNSSTQIFNNTIQQNIATAGGGIYGGSPQSIIVDNLIINNTAVYEGGGIGGASGIINNNTIDGNSGASRGGGIYITNTTCQLRNNIVVNSDSGGGIRCGAPPQNLSYNDVWNNNDDNFVDCSGCGSITKTNRNGIPCDDNYNIMEDPYFEDGYHLGSLSDCENAGDSITPFLPSTDFDGNSRIGGGFVDIGAYEYQSGLKGGGAKIISGDTSTSKLHLPAETPKVFGLSQSYPNPFNPVAVIEFTIGSDHPSNRITLKIYNITGQLVRTLLDEEKTPGTYTVTWDGKNDSSEEVASGIYFYELKSSSLREAKRMVLIK